MNKLIILDFHGVALRGSMRELCRWAAKVQKRPFQEMYDIIYWKWFARAVVGKISEQQFFDAAAKEVGMPGQGKKFRRIHLDAQKPNRRVFRYAAQLRKRGFEILLLSKNTAPQFKEYIRRFRLKEKFPYIINTYDLRLPKASKETVQYLLKKFHVRARDCYFIDDQKENLVEPKKAGMATHLYKNFVSFKQWLERELKKTL